MLGYIKTKLVDLIIDEFRNLSFTFYLNKNGIITIYFYIPEKTNQLNLLDKIILEASKNNFSQFEMLKIKPISFIKEEIAAEKIKALGNEFFKIKHLLMFYETKKDNKEEFHHDILYISRVGKISLLLKKFFIIIKRMLTPEIIKNFLKARSIESEYRKDLKKIFFDKTENQEIICHLNKYYCKLTNEVWIDKKTKYVVYFNNNFENKSTGDFISKTEIKSILVDYLRVSFNKKVSYNDFLYFEN